MSMTFEEKIEFLGLTKRIEMLTDISAAMLVCSARYETDCDAVKLVEQAKVICEEILKQVWMP